MLNVLCCFDVLLAIEMPALLIDELCLDLVENISLILANLDVFKLGFLLLLADLEGALIF